jgi:sugar lactone lactonase YvrE
MFNFRAPTKHVILGPLLLTPWLLASCSKDDDKEDPKATPLPDTIQYTREGLYPEGFAFDDKNRRFLVSSVTESIVFSVSETGEVTPFIEDDRIANSTGITVDAENNRILVSAGNVGTNLSKLQDPEQPLFQTNTLGVYNLSNGERIAWYSFSKVEGYSGSSLFGSEPVSGPDGSIYVTDSFQPVIFKVDPKGNMSVLIKNELFRPAPYKFGLNPMVYHPDGYLLVAKSDDGTLWKIPVDAPESFTKVQVEALTNADGMVLQGNNQLVLAMGTDDKVIRIQSTDAWKTATKNGEQATAKGVRPTAVNAAGDEIFYLESYLTKVLPVSAGGLNDRTHKDWALQKVKFQ